jgi:ubiquinone/menaquinone biosynthesis C-methylase UbiE
VSSANPFLDSSSNLYATPDRLAQRTGALHRAKIAGRNVADVIAELAPPQASLVADVGCGRGTTTAVLAQHLRPPALVALDASPALLAEARRRVREPGVRFVAGDFHSMPLADGTCDLIVAAFCLYHSPAPRMVIAEFARCLTPGGTAILVTKSADSYRELDTLVAASGLDLQATERSSLYATANGTNLPDLAGESLHIRSVIRDLHEFRFTGHDHVAAYLATSPKYALPEGIANHADAIADELRARLPDRPLITSSTVTYVIARRA